VQIVEHRRTASESSLVVSVPHCNSGDQDLNTLRLGAPEMRVFQVDVVDNLGQRL
jgi:hypothetical protein